MRLGLTYLLFLCLFFFKGHSCVLSGENKKPGVNYSAHYIQNNNSAELIGQGNAVDLLQNDVYIGEDDDDESGSPRGKGSRYSSSSTNDIISALSNLSGCFKNDQRPAKDFCYSPDKNIFMTVMKL